MSSLTICTVNCRTWKYLYFQNLTYRSLARENDFKLLICNVTPENAEAELLSQLPNSTVFFHDLQGLTGSEAHGAALNTLLPLIDTEYAAIIDPDTAALLQDWDHVCREALHQQSTVAIGTPYDPEATFRYQNFPNAFFLFFKVEPFRALAPDFRPQARRIRHWKRTIDRYWPFGEIPDHDVGWRLPRLFQKAGYKALSFEFLKCDSPRSKVLRPDARGSEFHWNGNPILTHQGRSAILEFNQDAMSQAWVEKVCRYIGITPPAFDTVEHGNEPISAVC